MPTSQFLQNLVCELSRTDGFVNCYQIHKEFLSFQIIHQEAKLAVSCRGASEGLKALYLSTVQRCFGEVFYELNGVFLTHRTSRKHIALCKAQGQLQVFDAGHHNEQKRSSRNPRPLPLLPDLGVALEISKGQVIAHSCYVPYIIAQTS